ncbi:MAG: GGDEF domain-containing protein [Phycisphaerae bacterium]|nr:GGDEF domain-containing protein [Phycisphaerae bacterium]
MSGTIPRQRRRRLLTIGPGGPLQGTTSLTAEPVESIYDVLGLIATCPARQPIEAVVITPSSPRALHDVIRSAEAVRRVDPTVQIVLRSSDTSTASLSGQIDHCLPPEADADVIARALDGDDTATLGQPPSVQTESTDSMSSTYIIGDTDLLESILEHTNQVVPLAVRAIEQRTSLGSLTYHASGAGGPDSTPVRRGLTTWGHLSGGDAATLEPWAGWLARWIALDEMINGLRYDASRDYLTNAWNRRSFEQFTVAAINEARQLRRELTVFVFVIDGFKHFNDRFGHEAGDTILTSMVQLLSSVVRNGDRVGRLGGDEFAVLFSDFTAPRTAGSRHPETVEVLAHRFQKQIKDLRFPELGLAAPGRLSISGGLATFPWDGDDPTSLLRIADQRALASKRRGKNCLTFGPSDD